MQHIIIVGNINIYVAFIPKNNKIPEGIIDKNYQHILCKIHSIIEVYMLNDYICIKYMLITTATI